MLFQHFWVAGPSIESCIVSKGVERTHWNWFVSCDGQQFRAPSFPCLRPCHLHLGQQIVVAFLKEDMGRSATAEIENKLDRRNKNDA
jgi:hypothetical protein